MKALYKELQPSDTFVVRLPYPFSNYDRQLVTLFYQPLIGPEAMSVFLTLWADAEQSEDREYAHYHLMNSLSIPIGKVFEARISLEAIGLLRTWKKEEMDQRMFTYELLPPLDAKSFFNDPLLSMFLFNKIGESDYLQLRKRFLKMEINISEYVDVSRSFLDVFQPVGNTNRLPSDHQNFEGKSRSKGIPFNGDFDFSLLLAGLSEQFIPKSTLTAVARETIAKLAFLYNYTPIDMQKVVILALDDEFKLTEERLKKGAADYYKLSVSKNAPQFKTVFDLPKMDEGKKENLSKEEELIYYLETTSPAQLLKDIANGKEPLVADVQLAERLVLTHQLPVGVVNVLLQYVLLRTDMKLTKSYVEKIASHWMRKNVKTAKEAMDLARNEHAQYLKWKNEGSKPTTPGRKKAVREEQVPEWFYKKETNKEKTKSSSQTNVNVEEERRRLLQELGVLKGEEE